jgi:HAD superfamily hydrolase (TIGR01509 family)
MLKAIVFDFDGVLANSEPLHYQAYRDVLADEGLALTRADYYGRYLGYDDVGAFRAMGADLGGPFSDDRIAALVRRKAAQMETLERDQSVLFPGAAETVRRAAAMLPLAIASGAIGAEIRRVLEAADLTASFSVIVAAEDTRLSKPAPDPYLRAVGLLSLATGLPIAPHECVAVEDSAWGLESARAAGLRTVAVAQTYAASELTIADLVIDAIASFDLQAVSRLCAE